VSIAIAIGSEPLSVMASVSEQYVEGLVPAPQRQHHGGKLSPKDFKEVYLALFEKRSHWRNIGIALGLIPTELSNIEAQYQDLDRRLQEMLSKWLNNDNLSPSWTSLVAALRSKIVEETCLALDIEQEHVLAPKRPKPIIVCKPAGIPSPAPHSPGSPSPVTKAFAYKPWFHSGISQAVAAQRLKESTHENCFLVRESKSNPGPSVYSLSVKFKGKVEFFQLFWDQHLHTFEIVGCGKMFNSPEELIEYYTTTPLTTGGVTLGIPLYKPSKRTSYGGQYTSVRESSVDP